MQGCRQGLFDGDSAIYYPTRIPIKPKPMHCRCWRLMTMLISVEKELFGSRPSISKGRRQKKVKIIWGKSPLKHWIRKRNTAATIGNNASLGEDGESAVDRKRWASAFLKN
jgi:hypothetical protein